MEGLMTPDTFEALGGRTNHRKDIAGLIEDKATFIMMAVMGRRLWPKSRAEAVIPLYVPLRVIGLFYTIRSITC